MIMTALKIDPTLQTFLPPLCEEERRNLESNLLERGCLSPIVTWQGTIVDGHNRYEICSRLNLPFETKEIEFESLEHATWWILTNQLGRRNLSPFQRAEAVLKLKPFAEAEARKNQGRRNDLYDNEKKSDSMESLKKLETLADMSHETLRKAERIIERNDEAVLEKLRTGLTTINKEYRAIRKTEGAEQKVRGWQEPFTNEIDASYVDPQTPIGSFADVSPRHLLFHLGTFSDEYLREAVMLLLERMLGSCTRKKAAMRIIDGIVKKYGKQPQAPEENHAPLTADEV